MLGKIMLLSAITLLSFVGTAAAGEDIRSPNAIMPGCWSILEYAQ
jgi:hypothetical protein